MRVHHVTLRYKKCRDIKDNTSVGWPKLGCHVDQNLHELALASPGGRGGNGKSSSCKRFQNQDIFGYVNLLGVQIGKCMTSKHILTRNCKHIGKQRAMISMTKPPCHSLERLYDPTTNVLLYFCCTFMSRRLPYINFL